VLKPGDVVELPLFYLAFFGHTFHRMVIRDIENYEYEIPPSEVEGMRRKLREKEANSRLRPSGWDGGPAGRLKRGFSPESEPFPFEHLF
jgi:hypothetical protein